MKRFVHLLILIYSTQTIFAQQDPDFTLYNYNINIVNPAAAGINAYKEISLNYRSQWLGIEDAPNTQAVSYTTPLKNNLGFGVSIVRDEVFIYKETDISFDISYKIKATEEHDIYFGIKAGGSFVNIDLTNAGAIGSDPLYDENIGFFNTQIGAGIYLKHQNYYISVSTPNFLVGKRYLNTKNPVKVATDNFLHMYYGMGYHFNISEKFKVTPGFMYRNVSGAPSSLDINATFTYNNKIDFGVNYRVDEMYAAYTMLPISDKIKFGAAYGFASSNLSQLNDDGSIELMVRFFF